MITSPAAHYLLFAEAAVDPKFGGTWRFVLEDVAAGESLAAYDYEPIECHERLELLAVVRGLEAIGQASRVTLVTKSRYVSRGLKRGLADWRANGWQWERFGRVVPVRDHDLWKRVDQALRFHQVDCRLWSFNDEAAAEPAVPAVATLTAAALPVASQPSGRLAAARERFRRVSRAAASLGEALRPARPAGLAAG